MQTSHTSVRYKCQSLDSFLGVNGISRFSPGMIQCLSGTDAATMPSRVLTHCSGSGKAGQSRRDSHVEDEPLHLQPFAALLGDLLANASASASSRKKSTAIPASLSVACTHCDRSAVSQQLLYEATGVNWSVERQSITPPGSESPTSLRLARFGCCMSFSSVWEIGAQRIFQFQRVFATPQQVLAYFLDSHRLSNNPFKQQLASLGQHRHPCFPLPCLPKYRNLGKAST